jgi:glycosyltransferase involved in cell wall biosynthesis
MDAPALRIGIDGREIVGDATGVGRYLSELLLRWTSRSDAPRRRFVLFVPTAPALPLPAAQVDVRILRAAQAGTWWEQTTLAAAARREALSVFFAPAYTAPVGLSMPLALTVHDVSFLAHPEWFRPRERWRRRWLTRHSARAASVVFTDSEFSRDEILRHIRIEASRVQVIPPGGSARTEPSAVPGRREPLVLFTGSVFNRRRLPQLIEAFALAAHDHPAARLAIVGANRTWPRQDLGAIAAAHGVADRLELRNYVSDLELAALYRRAAVFAFLSEYEGFGLTPLEALAAGVPAVVLDTPVAREVCGPAVTYLPFAADARQLAEILRDALRGGEAVRMPLAHAGAVLRRYSWAEAAERTLLAIEEAACR